MECPPFITIRNSISFHTSCKSSAVSGGQIASLAPWMAIVGGSGKEVVADVAALGCGGADDDSG